MKRRILKLKGYAVSGHWLLPEEMLLLSCLTATRYSALSSLKVRLPNCEVQVSSYGSRQSWRGQGELFVIQLGKRYIYIKLEVVSDIRIEALEVVEEEHG